MAEQIHAQSSRRDGDDVPDTPLPSAPLAHTAALDDVLADIDDVLEVNALSFVQGFKQKGGQ